MIQMSRSIPPQVPAIVHQGVRYEQVMNGIRQGLPHRNGYLSATDVASGQRLWTAQVYEVQYDAALEKDVQDVYFKQMALTPDQQQLSIENEAGKRFLVNLSSHAVTPAP